MIGIPISCKLDSPIDIKHKRLVVGVLVHKSGDPITIRVETNTVASLTLSRAFSLHVSRHGRTRERALHVHGDGEAAEAKVLEAGPHFGLVDPVGAAGDVPTLRQVAHRRGVSHVVAPPVRRLARQG